MARRSTKRVASAPKSSRSQASTASSATHNPDVADSMTLLTLDTSLQPLQRSRSKVPETPFPFLSLPAELRIKVYDDFFADITEVLDLNRDNHKRIHKRLGLMRVCRLVSEEATHRFYSTRTFRLFPTTPGRFFKTKKPLLARLSPRQRRCLTSLEMRLGPGWCAPPAGWVVNPALGLADCAHVHTLRVYVQVDPSDNTFTHFRRADGFYEAFSRDLLARTLQGLPSVRTVEFDAYESVQKKGAMMRSLMSVATGPHRRITWGPDRGWFGTPDDDEPPVKNGVPNRYLDSIPVEFATQNFVAVA